MVTALRRLFSLHDQEIFALYSGDSNPMHMDPVAARRTKAGSTVVHGVHTLLWCLDGFAESLNCKEPKAFSIAVSFENFVYVGEEVEARVTLKESSTVRIEAVSNGSLVMRIMLFLDGKNVQEVPRGSYPLTQAVNQPLDRPLSEISQQGGRLEQIPPQATSLELFPHACALLGTKRISSLASYSYIVGMLCPGLHSTFRALALDLQNEQSSDDTPQYFVKNVDERFKIVRLQVSEGGWSGVLTTHLRPAPVSQCSIQKLQVIVDPTEFKGLRALVIGGSRGLGELTAKLLAAGGAKVAITYFLGQSDAELIQSAIHDFGGSCEIFRLDITRPVDGQFTGISFRPSHLYYFATPHIKLGSSTTFDDRIFQNFSRIYVSGFYEIFSYLQEAVTDDLYAFYPSTSFLDQSAPGFLEYIAAKGAGESLCTQINLQRNAERVLVDRLPRLPTDQTAGMTDIQLEDPVDRILHNIRRLNSSSLLGRSRSA